MFSRLSSKQKLLKVGWVKDAHSLRGEVYVQLTAKTADWLDSAAELFLQAKPDEAHLPMKIERAKPFKDGLLVKFEGVNDRNASEALRKHLVFIDEELLVAGEGDPVFLNQLLDFVVFDKDFKVGTVVGFATNGAQDLLRVQLDKGGEALVPLVDAYILSIDFDKLHLSMDLPPGLLTVDTDREERSEDE